MDVFQHVYEYWPPTSFDHEGECIKGADICVAKLVAIIQ